MDVLLATGEQQTIALTAMAINALGGKACSLTGAQAGIQTDGVHTKARIANITPTEVHEMLDEGNIVILAGFQGQTRDGPHHHPRPRRLGSDRDRHGRSGESRPLPDLHRRRWCLHL